ncbi:hypothetical protein [Micromonospora robiginosa]|uniref:Uncharacterized protein n=1 Tax=Micromonospora robiginosa TaxID=2749844 RepID=A0A7L6B7R5_9ACTN|nr:hypothetical protein [Micromonospora ferruginea]QLQ38007.1 hypothetical protein H1D33_03690 [Micromonospora ferruginea]
MSTLSEQLDQQNATLGTVRDGLAGIQADVRILIERAAGDPEAQAAADRVQATLDGLVGELGAFRSETPDADGSDTPATDPGEPETFSRR